MEKVGLKGRRTAGEGKNSLRFGTFSGEHGNRKD